MLFLAEADVCFRSENIGTCILKMVFLGSFLRFNRFVVPLTNQRFHTFHPRLTNQRLQGDIVTGSWLNGRLQDFIILKKETTPCTSSPRLACEAQVKAKLIRLVPKPIERCRFPAWALAAFLRHFPSLSGCFPMIRRSGMSGVLAKCA